MPAGFLKVCFGLAEGLDGLLLLLGHYFVRADHSRHVLDDILAFVYQIGLFQFNNPGGLKREGDSLYSQTAASGQPLNESTNANLDKSKVVQGYLEGSNVNVADEMVNMITTQRAYEFNSKVITTSDTMLEEANNLRR